MFTYFMNKKVGFPYKAASQSPCSVWRGQHPLVKQIIRSATLQPKLSIGMPNDKYEQEADRVADQVMQINDPHPSVSYGQTIQRSCAHTAKREKETLIQTKRTAGETAEMTPAMHSEIQALRGGGRQLSGADRDFFEPRFGMDFSNVRVHDDTRSAAIASSMNARAFTFGQDVVFSSGEYASGTGSGKRLLAHELTHVIQQRNRQGGPHIQRRVYDGHDHGGRYEIDDNDCTFSYHQNWFFTFRTNQTPAERERYMQAAKRQIEDVWSEKYPLIPDQENCACYPNGFTVSVAMHPHERERRGRGFTAIITTTEQRGFTNQPLRNIDLGTRHETPLNMGEGLTQQRVAHEFGHTIGLTDEYHGWAGLFNTRGSRDRPSIMHSGDEVRPRHYQHFADLIKHEILGCTYSPAGRRVRAYENPALSVTGLPFTNLVPQADFVIGLNIDRRLSNSAMLGLIYPTTGLMSVWNPEDRSSLVGPTLGVRLNQIAHPLYVNMRTGVLFDPEDPTSVSGIHIPIGVELGIRQEGFQAGINYTAISNVLGSGGWTHLVGVGMRVELPSLSDLIE